MKIALNRGFGKVYFPESFIIPSGVQDTLGVRRALAEFFETSGKKYWNGNFANQYNVTYRVAGVMRENTCYWEVVDVDTSRLWMIYKHDGAEHIRYYKPDENNQLKEED